MSIASGVKYTFTQLPESKEWLRLISGMINIAQDYKIDTLCSAKLGPIGNLARGLDGAHHGRETLKDLDSVVLEIRRYVVGNTKGSLQNIFNKTVGLVGDVCATLKWVGTFGGVVMLASHTKSFGYVKNVCSIYLASIAMINGVGTFYQKCRSNDEDKTKEMFIATATIVIAICSIWLNGMGGLASWVGDKAFTKRGMQPLPAWVFNNVGVLACSVGILKRIAKEGESVAV